jgi:hypothetical protein
VWLPGCGSVLWCTVHSQRDANNCCISWAKIADDV